MATCPPSEGLGQPLVTTPNSVDPSLLKTGVPWRAGGPAATGLSPTLRLVVPSANCFNMTSAPGKSAFVLRGFAKIIITII